jgi:RNA polymerase sigma-70 factor (ECF subfamily)
MLPASIPTRRSLLSRLRDCGDHKSWQEFYDTYGALVKNTALKQGLREDEAQEVVQETFINLSQQMPGFRYDPQKGTFRAWLLQQTRWRIADQFRQRTGETAAPATTPGDTGRSTSPIERIPDPGETALTTLWDREWRENLQGVAIKRVKRKADPKAYQIFDLYVFREWSAAKVGKAVGVPIHQVYLAKYRIGRLIRQEIKRLEAGLTR